MNESDMAAKVQAEVELLQGRYEVVCELGRGGQGRMLLAKDHRTQQMVAVKKLDVGHVESWKAIELFERECTVLRSLNNPAIPAYIDSFSVQHSDGAGVEFYLVQEFVEGQSFAQWIEQGLRVEEDFVWYFLEEMLRVLQSLHELSPPVLHRDIKPSNILWRNDGRLMLADLGAVQATVHEGGGSTIVGTNGYMALEQLMGRACAATDLYALGATVVHLLSHRHPSDLPVEDMAMVFRPYVKVSEPLAEFLDGLLAPYLEDRFSSAARALERLHAVRSTMISVRGSVIEVRERAEKPRKRKTSIKVSKDGGMQIGIATGLMQKATMLLGVFPVVIIALVLIGTAISSPAEPRFAKYDGAGVERPRSRGLGLNLLLGGGGLLLFGVVPGLFYYVASSKKFVLNARDGNLSLRGMSDGISFEDIEMMGIRTIQQSDGGKARSQGKQGEHVMFIQSREDIVEFGWELPLQEQQYVLGELRAYVDDYQRQQSER